jgi:hypothetical protein
METTAMPRRVTLHEQSCHSLDLATLLAGGGVSDIGAFDSAQSALNSVITSLHDVNICHACCSMVIARQAIAKIDIRQSSLVRFPEFSKSPLTPLKHHTRQFNK